MAESSRGVSVNRGRAFIDRIDGTSALIYIDPETSNPAALFVNAKTARFEGNDVRLDNGDVVRSGVLMDRAGKAQTADRPQQMFTRWYGFAPRFTASKDKLFHLIDARKPGKTVPRFARRKWRGRAAFASDFGPSSAPGPLVRLSIDAFQPLRSPNQANEGVGRCPGRIGE